MNENYVIRAVSTHGFCSVCYVGRQGGLVKLADPFDEGMIACLYPTKEEAEKDIAGMKDRYRGWDFSAEVEADERIRLMFKVTKDKLYDGKIIDEDHTGTYWLPSELATDATIKRGARAGQKVNRLPSLFKVAPGTPYLKEGEPEAYIKRYDRKEHIGWRVMGDDYWIKTLPEKERNEQIMYYGTMLKSMFDEDLCGGDDISLPLDTLGRGAGCVDIEHKVDGQWTLVVG